MKAMKRAISLCLMLVILLVSTSAVSAGGFVDNRNDNARLYNGFYEENIYLVMKWSKDWIPMAHQEAGAWCTNHYTWYTDDYGQGYYGYELPSDYGSGAYKIEEFIKMKAIDDELVPEYQANAIWGNIIILTDHLVIYDNMTGEVVYETDLYEPLHPGLGNLKY